MSKGGTRRPPLPMDARPRTTWTADGLLPSIEWDHVATVLGSPLAGTPDKKILDRHTHWLATINTGRLAAA